MLYVTKFINVIGSYYGEIGINGANSTGATDVIVVQQIDGNLLSTPFHARFGKLNILRPKEVIVDLYLNDEYIKEVDMRVEPTGEAYFELQEEETILCKIQQDDIRIKINEGNDLVKDISRRQEANDLGIVGTGLDNSNLSKHSEFPAENIRAVECIDSGYKSSDEQEFQMYDFTDESKLSLCGGLSDLKSSSSQSMDRFFSSLVSYEEFIKRPNEILNNSNLVVLSNNKFMDWKTFSFVMLSRFAYNERIPENLATDILQTKKTTRNYRKWIPWGYYDNTTSSVPCSSQHISPLTSNENLNVSYNSRMRTLSGDIFYSDNSNAIMGENNQDETVSGNINVKNQSIPHRSVDDSAVHFVRNGMKRTNILPSEKLKLLKLTEGMNELVYVITGKYRGTIKVGCKVYLWNWADRIVISDIDGTITKSDVWGQLAPWLGLDWTQSGIVKLYNSIQRNHFRFVYLSARAIGQADQTRQYLENVNQQDMFLPDGPLLLAPSSLFIAFKKEVIEKVPEEFKIKCLNELKSLFPLSANSHALYAGFGNKPSDEITYISVGIPKSKIFTVNKKGEVCNKALMVNAMDPMITYDTLYQLVDHYFPTKDTEILYSNEYSSLAYWGEFIS